MRTGSITYPYWENAARFAEDWLALLFLKKREDKRYKKYMERQALLEAEKAKLEANEKDEENGFGKDPSLNTL